MSTSPLAMNHESALTTLLIPLDADHLRALLVDLVTAHPGLETWVRCHLAGPAPVPSISARFQRSPTLPRPEPRTVQEQVGAVFQPRPSYRGGRACADGDAQSRALNEIASGAREYLDAGDGEGALIILNQVADAARESNEELNLSDEALGAQELWENLGRLLAEALLLLPPGDSERAIEWAERIGDWKAAISDSGLGAHLEIARLAALQGWSDPQLQSVLSGETPGFATAEELAAEAERFSQEDEEDWEEEVARGKASSTGTWKGSAFESDPDWDEEECCFEDPDAEFHYQPGDVANRELNTIRLAILGRQGLEEEYLRLAMAAGLIGQYLVRMLSLGRAQEALSQARHHLGDLRQAWDLCESLERVGEGVGALDLADWALASLPASHYAVPLLRCSRDLARRLEDRERALSLGLALIRCEPDLRDWRVVESIAGASWPNLRATLLGELGAQRYDVEEGVVDILLHEGCTEAAMERVSDDSPHWIVGKVVDQVSASHPEWAYRACRNQFDVIADAGRSKDYDFALEWLEQARTVLRNAGRESEWRVDLEGIIRRHRRKYTLRPRLEKLRR